MFIGGQPNFQPPYPPVGCPHNRGRGRTSTDPIVLHAMVTTVAIYKLIANGSFGPDEIEVMKGAYEAALVDVGVTDRNDPITELIAKSIVNVTATGERDPHRVMERALNALGVRRAVA
jgi:hypothetical protein